MAVMYARTRLECATAASGYGERIGAPIEIDARPTDRWERGELRHAGDVVRAHQHVHEGRALEDRRAFELRHAAAQRRS